MSYELNEEIVLFTFAVEQQLPDMERYSLVPKSASIVEGIVKETVRVVSTYRQPDRPNTTCYTLTDAHGNEWYNQYQDMMPRLPIDLRYDTFIHHSRMMDLSLESLPITFASYDYYVRTLKQLIDEETQRPNMDYFTVKRMCNLLDLLLN
jgi:hypothetical protein